MGSTLSLIFPPKAKWSVDQIPNLSGRVVVVTGGNTGIGKETAKALLQHGAKVYIAARSQSKAEQAIQDLQQQTGEEALFLKLDLSNLRSIKLSAEEFLSKETRLDVLFNNAGVMYPDIKELTSDGYDLQFGTNVLGHFYFTKLLLPLMVETAKTSLPATVRVVNVSSMGHLSTSHLDIEAYKDAPKRRKIGTHGLYAHSKFGNIVYSNELARRYGSDGIISVSLHPGAINSELARNMNPMVQWLSSRLFYPPSMGALTQLYAGTTPIDNPNQLNGKYLIPWARMGEARSETNNPETGKILWEWMEEQVAGV